MRRLDVEALELADDPDPDDVPAAVADSCDSPVCKATALLDAATSMRDLGDRAAARELAVRSARSFSRKGHRVGAGWARALIAEVPR